MAREFRLWVTVLAWVDGDTFHGIIDQGFHTFAGSVADPIRIRCAKINAPELSTPGGPAAKALAEKLAPPGVYACTSYRPDKYGRPLLDLHLTGGRLFSDAMLTLGAAVEMR